MITRLHTVAALSALGLSMLFCHNAAACSLGGADGPLPAGLSNAMVASALAPASDWHQTVPGMSNPWRAQEPITGMYRFTFTAGGSVADQGFTTWHADGTEIMNSGRAPMTQSFCMGVWTRTGAQTYRLNHWALSWDATGKVFVGPANIREYVTLSRDGNSYAGTFKLTQYDSSGKNVLGVASGTVAATRVTADN